MLRLAPVLKSQGGSTQGPHQCDDSIPQVYPGSIYRSPMWACIRCFTPFTTCEAGAEFAHYLRIMDFQDLVTCTEAQLITTRHRIWSAITKLRSHRHVVKLEQCVRKYPRPAAGVGVVVLLVIGWLVFSGGPRAAFAGLFAGPSVPELKRHLRAHPGDADARLELGHAYFERNQHRKGVQAYKRALGQKAGVLDGEAIDNLVATLETASAKQAASLIKRYRIQDAKRTLEKLAVDASYAKRRRALATLETLGKVPGRIYVEASLLDLSHPDCSVRKGAVSRLGRFGDRKVLPKLRRAAKKDSDETPWYRSDCLEDVTESAIARINRRR